MKKKKLLILKLDAIGDFILFERSIDAIVKDCRKNNRRPYLIGNKVWKELIPKEYKAQFNSILWVDIIKFQNNRFYRRFVLFLAGLLKFHMLIVPVFSRRYYIEEEFSKCIRADRKVAPLDDNLNKRNDQVEKSNKIYSDLIHVDFGAFELEKYQEFFKKFIDEYSMTKPGQKLAISSSKIAIAPFAGESKRELSLDTIINLILKLKKSWPNLEFHIIGPCSKRKVVSEKFTNLTFVYNECCNIELSKIESFLNSCSILIGMDSSPVHIAAKMGLDFICISNANHYQRFHPYNNKYTNSSFKYVYPKKIDNYSNEEKVIKFLGGSDLNINSISADQIFKEFKQLLELQKG